MFFKKETYIFLSFREILGLVETNFSTFWLAEPKCTEIDLKKTQICPIWHQSSQFVTKPATSETALQQSAYLCKVLHALRDIYFLSVNHYTVCTLCVCVQLLSLLLWL